MRLADLFHGNRIKVLALGLGIIVVTNLVALGGVAYNRSGQPDAVVELTERELGLPYNYGINRENTGLQLRIQCRAEDANEYNYSYGNCSGSPAWLDQAKMIELGFELEPWSEEMERRWGYRSELSRQVYVVLEFDGPAYQRTVAKAEADLKDAKELAASNPGREEFTRRVQGAQERLDTELVQSSRLFLVDAGADMQALRTRYGDAAKFVIMRALVYPFLRGEKDDTKWWGTISQLVADRVNVPLEHRTTLGNVEVFRGVGIKALPPRYAVTLAFGKRAEPWVLSTRGL